MQDLDLRDRQDIRSLIEDREILAAEMKLRRILEDADEHFIARQMADMRAAIEHWSPLMQLIHDRSLLLRMGDLSAREMADSFAGIKDAIEQAEDVDERDRLKRTALMHGLMVELGGPLLDPRHRLALVGHLLARGADINASDVDGMTPLMHTVSCKTPDPRTVEFLCNHGAQLESRDRAGRTALIHAAISGFTPVVESLVRLGADLSARDSDNRNAWEAFERRRDEKHRMIEKLKDGGVLESRRGFRGLVARLASGYWERELKKKMHKLLQG